MCVDPSLFPLDEDTDHDSSVSDSLICSLKFSSEALN